MTTQEMNMAFILSNVLAVVLLIFSWKRKNVARILFSFIFICASLANWNMAYTNPEDYLQYEKYAVGIYKHIITAEFSKHITGYVSVIAVCQFLIGIGFLARGMIVQLSALAGIIFFLAIAPLGFGAAFPFSIIASFALYLLYKHHYSKDIFKNKWWV